MKKVYLLFLLALLPLMASAVIERTIHVAKAGTLSNYISEDEMYKIERLTLTGEINGEDIRILRLMTGGVVECDESFLNKVHSPGILSTLDLSGVKIVSGGVYLTILLETSGPVRLELDRDNEIPSRAFVYCRALTSITLPNSVTSIGSQAFADTPWYENQPDGLVYAGKVLYKYKGTMSDGTKIKIKDGTLGIAGDAFSGCSSLTSITIPSSVTSIGDGSFRQCSGLTSITIPNSVTSIGDYAFDGCSGLTSITIPNSVTSIGDAAFSGCKGLTSITIPNSVTSIGFFAFEFCSGLTSITIPNSVTFLGYRAFYGCVGLTSVIIGNGVSKIDEQTFVCDKLKTLIIGKGVTEILWHAFIVPALTDVYCHAENVPKDIYGSFKNSNATLHVPAGSLDAYKAATPWSYFKNIVAISSNVKLNKSKATVEKGKTLTLKATVTPADLPDKSVTWKSSNTKVATVTSTGKVKGVKAGTATITCTSTVSGAKATCKVTVGYVTLDKSEAVIKKGKTLTLTPAVYPSSLTDKSVTWKSSDESIATVTSEGKVKGVKYGTATITCTSNATGLSITCKVTVGLVKLDKTNATIEKGTTLTLKPTVYPSSLEDKSVKWTSSDKTVATVSSSGKVKGIKAGTATITCTSVATGLSATCKVTVINGTVTLNKTETFIEKGKTTTLKATLTPTTLEDMSVTWTSSDKTVATVSSSGKVKGVGYGTATITCTSVATGVSATCQVTIGKVVINIPEFTLRRTRTATLAVTLYPTTLTDKSVTWESSDTKVATVSSSGKVKGVGAGTATITCTSNATGLKGTCTVTVLAVSESRSFEGDDDTTGIDEVENAPAEILPFDVYDLNGRKVAHQVTTFDGLPNGLYIVNGKKMLKK